VASKTENPAYLRAHDYAWLTRRWRELARREGLVMREFALADDFPVHVVESRPRAAGAPRLYLSAGIHGDEPAATEALITWAGRRARALRGCEFMIFPCLNPWGLQHNSRHDAHGRDLNRAYRRCRLPVIRAHKALLRGRTFDLALMLHEDFDAQGVYLYEIPGARPYWGEQLLAAAAEHVPCEPRRNVEGRRCRGGLIRTRINPDMMPDHPEAFLLHFNHTRRSLTFETPSEFSLTSRVEAHAAVLDKVLELAAGP
jgi:murein peptide amidase A